MNKGKIFIISGPSGSGKNTILEKVLANEKLNLKKVTTHTTRQKRPHETYGVDHYFVDKDSFIKMLENDEILEHNIYNGHYYGTPKSEIESILNSSKNAVMEIDVNGAKNIKKHYPETHLIFIKCDLGSLRQRLLNRGTNTEDQIIDRLKTAEEELGHIDFYDFIVENKDGELEKACDDLSQLITKLISDQN